MNLYNFLELIESEPSVQFLRPDDSYGYKSRVYQGSPGSPVFVDMEDEEIEDDIMIVVLTGLGLEDVIRALFPRYSLKPQLN